MRASILTTVLLSTLALATPLTTNANANDLAARDTADTADTADKSGAMQPLACKKNKCKCRAKTAQGQYCGWGTAVTNLGSGGAKNHVYECSPSGGCCDYGYRADCA